jgi:hypothetical protein
MFTALGGARGHGAWFGDAGIPHPRIVEYTLRHGYSHSHLCRATRQVCGARGTRSDQVGTPISRSITMHDALSHLTPSPHGSPAIAVAGLAVARSMAGGS